MLRYLILTILVPGVLFSGCADPRRVDSYEGGWKGNDVRMTCRHDGDTFLLAIENGKAKVEVNGLAFGTTYLTYTPFGFVMTHRGTSYAPSFKQRKLSIGKTTRSGITDIQCELCERPVTDAQISFENVKFTIPGKGWCPPDFARLRIPPHTRTFVRLAQDPLVRDAKDNVLTKNESAHIYMASVSKGTVKQLDEPIPDASALKEFIEPQMQRALTGAHAPTSLRRLLLGRGMGTGGQVWEWRFLQELENRNCIALEFLILGPRGRLTIRKRSRACLHPSGDGRIVVASFNNTYVINDDGAKARSENWAKLGERFLRSVQFTD